MARSLRVVVGPRRGAVVAYGPGVAGISGTPTVGPAGATSSPSWSHAIAAYQDRLPRRRPTRAWNRPTWDPCGPSSQRGPSPRGQLLADTHGPDHSAMLGRVRQADARRTGTTDDAAAHASPHIARLHPPAGPAGWYTRRPHRGAGALARKGRAGAQNVRCRPAVPFQPRTCVDPHGVRTGPGMTWGAVGGDRVR